MVTFVSPFRSGTRGSARGSDSEGNVVMRLCGILATASVLLLAGALGASTAGAAQKSRATITIEDDGGGTVSGMVRSRPELCNVPDPVVLYRVTGSKEKKIGKTKTEGSDDGPFWKVTGVRVGIRVFARFPESDDCKAATSKTIKTTRQGSARILPRARGGARYRTKARKAFYAGLAVATPYNAPRYIDPVRIAFSSDGDRAAHGKCFKNGYGTKLEQYKYRPDGPNHVMEVRTLIECHHHRKFV